MKTLSIEVKGPILSVVILRMCLSIWHMATTHKVVPSAGISTNSSEYNNLIGQGSGEPVQKTGFPTLSQMRQTIYKQLSHPFYDNGPNDKGLCIRLAYSLARVGLGFLFAMIVATPFGF